MTRFLLVLCAALIAICQSTSAQTVLTNGDFETAPPNGYGNHINWSVAPWVLTAGQTNVVEVDGPGGLAWYGSNGPASDATGGAGRPQHYFDQANIFGTGTIYQDFTPLCDGEVTYGTYFSTRGNASGVGSVWIMDATGTNVIAGPATVTVPGGNSELDPWQLAAFTAVLTAGTTYRFRIDMDNQLNTDNAFVRFGPECTEYTDPCWMTGETCEGPDPIQCAPFEQGELTCDQTTGSYVILLQNTLAGTFDPTDLTLSTATPGVTISQNQFNPLEFTLTGVTPGQTLTLTTDSVQTGAGEGTGLDLCCAGEVDITIPEGLICEGPLDVSVSKVWKDFMESAANTVPHGFEVVVDLPLGHLNPGDVVTVRDPASSQVNVTSFGSPVAPAPWTCSMSGQSWTCQYVVPATGAVLPATISWPSIIDGEQHVKNCADVAVERGGQSLAETSTVNNQDCWEANAPNEGEGLLAIVKDGPASCQPGAFCEYIYTVTNSGNAPYTGPITLVDHMTPVPLSGQTGGGSSGGRFVGIAPALCPNPPDLTGPGCTGTATIPAGGFVTYTVTYAPQVMTGGGDYDLENCVDLLAGTPGVEAPVGTDCHRVHLDPPALDLVKTGPAVCDIGASCDFTVTISNISAAPYSGTVALTDQTTVSGFAVANVAPMPPGCGGNLPANPFSCVIALTNFGPGQSQSYTLTMTPDSAFGQVVADTGENCASLVTVPPGVTPGDYSWNWTTGGAGAMPNGFADIMQYGAPFGDSCLTYASQEGVPPSSEPEFHLSKSCQPILLDPATGTGEMDCSLILSADNLVPGQLMSFVDVLSAASGGQPGISGSFSNVSTSGNGQMSCSDTGISPPRGACTMSTDDFMAAQPLSVHWTATISGAADLGVSTLQNCVLATTLDPATDNAYVSPQVCVDIPIAVADTPRNAQVALPPLTLTKTSLSDCEIDRDAQVYRCDFGLAVFNATNQTYSGPVVVTDTFGTPRPSGLQGVSGLGWDCTPSSGNGTTCLYQGDDIPSAGSAGVRMTVVLPGQPSGGSFENCAELGLPEDEDQVTRLMQTALNGMGIDVGPADGKVGPNTRSGISELQQRLGLPETGEITPDLVAAAGLVGASGALPSCVTVDLPPMPRPDLQCDAATTVKRGNACVCRYSQMYERNASTCTCVQGTRFVAGEGCVRNQRPATASTPRPTTPTTPTPPVVNLRCDAQTTLETGGACECRYSGMIRLNSRACTCASGSRLVPGRGCVRERERNGSSDNP